MKTIQLVSQQLQARRNQESQYTEALNAILNYRAAEKDKEVTNRLLKRLVLNYSNAESNLFELNQLKNKFLGIAAHDLRNPLASIRGFSELLLSEDMGALSDDQREFIGTIHSLSQDMLSMVNDLLDVAVIESGKLEINRESGSLKALIESRIHINSIMAETKGMTIDSDLAEIPEIPFDRNRIGQVLDNLISNAIKYSPLGSNIHISLDRAEKMAKTSVEDEGPGIEAEEQERLFGEFQKMSTKPTGGEKSTGLGLAIAKKIVEAHGGVLEVESRPGNGSTFRFLLPLEEN